MVNSRSSSRRRPRLEYSADHLDGHFYIRTNRDAKNFKLVRRPGSITGPGPLGGGRAPPSRRLPGAV